MPWDGLHRHPGLYSFSKLLRDYIGPIPDIATHRRDDETEPGPYDASRCDGTLLRIGQLVRRSAEVRDVRDADRPLERRRPEVDGLRAGGMVDEGREPGRQGRHRASVHGLGEACSSSMATPLPRHDAYAQPPLTSQLAQTGRPVKPSHPADAFTQPHPTAAPWHERGPGQRARP